MHVRAHPHDPHANGAHEHEADCHPKKGEIREIKEYFALAPARLLFFVFFWTYRARMMETTTNKARKATEP